MSALGFTDLLRHYGHKIHCVYYGISKEEAHCVAIECWDCHEILFDFERGQEPPIPEDFKEEITWIRK